MTRPTSPAAAPSNPSEGLQEQRADARRHPGAVLVRDASGGDPIPWEDPPAERGR